MRLIITAAHLLFAFSICCGQQVQKTIKRLPDTGQTKSYTSTFGEDNDYNIFVPYYLSNGNGTITDTVTGLMWQQTDGGEMTFENAIAYAENMILGGYDDWRLPSAFEAFTIQIHQNNNPALNTTFFTKNNAEYWWTSDRQKNDPNKIWVTNSGGGIGNHLKTETVSAGGTKRYHARAVRDIDPPVMLADRFENMGDNTVKDHLTGLTWQKTPYTKAVGWEDALSYAEELALSGLDDWRLPNIKELQSLQDAKLIQPCINTGFFPNIGIKKYWSSTSLANQDTRAWYLDTNFGITTYDLKTNTNYVLCVRGNTGENVSALTPIYQSRLPARIFPNPARSTLNIEFDNALKEGIIVIFSADGIQVRSLTIAAGQNHISLDVNNLAQGRYILYVSIGDKIHTLNFTKL